MFITGPDVIKTVTHEEVTKEALGGAAPTTRSRAWPLRRARRAAAIALLRELLSYLPSEQHGGPAAPPTADDRREPRAPSSTLVPTDPNKPYDIKR
jgi:propionyl-CoA carboxylase beta chain